MGGEEEGGTGEARRGAPTGARARTGEGIDGCGETPARTDPPGRQPPRRRGQRPRGVRRRAGSPPRRSQTGPPASRAAAEPSTSTASSGAPSRAASGRSASGGEPTEVHTVSFREIAAVISDTPEEVLDATRENVLAHERVNETVMKSFTVIPMSFGTVFKTRDDIVELLRGAYDAFRDVLDKMQDKVEFGLKVLWDRDVMVREIENDDDDIRRLKNEISGVRGSTYFARMQYGRQIDAALQARSEQYVADIFAQLRDVSVAARANKPIGEKMIMNAAFLVSRDKETAFDAKVKEVGALYDKLNFRYTGPWPPYNFVNIRLKLERAREAE